MNIIIFCMISSAAAFTWTNNTLEDMKRLTKESVIKCSIEYGLPPNTTMEFFRVNSTAPTVQKCFLACFITRIGVMRMDDGTIDIPIAKEHMEKWFKTDFDEKYKQIDMIKKCAAELKSDPTDLCVTTFNYMLCRRNTLGPDYKYVDRF